MCSELYAVLDAVSACPAQAIQSSYYVDFVLIAATACLTLATHINARCWVVACTRPLFVALCRSILPPQTTDLSPPIHKVCSVLEGTE